MSNQQPDEDSLLAFASFRYDAGNTASSIPPTSSTPVSAAGQAMGQPQAQPGGFYNQDMMSNAGYYDQLYKQQQQQYPQQPPYFPNPSVTGYPYTPVDMSSQTAPATQSTAIFNSIPDQHQQQHHQGFNPGFRYPPQQNPVHSPPPIAQHDQRYSQMPAYGNRQHQTHFPSGTPSHSAGQLHHQYQFPPPAPDHRRVFPSNQSLGPPSPPSGQAVADPASMPTSSAGYPSDINSQSLMNSGNQHQHQHQPFSYVPTTAAITPVHGGNTRSRGPRRRRTGSKRSLEDMILDSIIPTNVNTSAAVSGSRKGPFVGLLTGTTEEGLSFSASASVIPQGATGGPILPLTLTEPPLSAAAPINPNALVSDTQARPKKKSKYTPEQDAIILQMKKDGKAWSEISQAAQCGNSLAARNRYQVLIGQQGGGAVAWDTQDTMTLKHLLEDGERAKWEFVASELSRMRSVHVSEASCRKKIKELFDRDPTSFGVSVGLSAESSGHFEPYMGGAGLPGFGLPQGHSAGGPNSMTSGPEAWKPNVAYGPQEPSSQIHHSANVDLPEFSRQEFDFG